MPERPQNHPPVPRVSAYYLRFVRALHANERGRMRSLVDNLVGRYAIDGALVVRVADDLINSPQPALSGVVAPEVALRLRQQDTEVGNRLLEDLMNHDEDNIRTLAFMTVHFAFEQGKLPYPDYHGLSQTRLGH